MCVALVNEWGLQSIVDAALEDVCMLVLQVEITRRQSNPLGVCRHPGLFYHGLNDSVNEGDRYRLL